MPIDRVTTLKNADRLLQQGKLAAAINEYVRLVEDQPRDWNSINALGDLYVRAGDSERAASRFAEVADHLYSEGFYPKAAAVYKKALKAKRDHEHALVRLVDIAERQRTFADAKALLRELIALRDERGDAAGADVYRARLEALEQPRNRKSETIVKAPAAPIVAADASDEPVAAAAAPEPADELGSALAALRMHVVVLPPMPAAADETIGADGLDSVFGAMRARVTHDQDAHAGDRYERGQQHLREGRLVEAFGELQVAAMTPALRFAAASSIGRALASLGEYKDAVEWMERASEAPPPSIEEGRALLSDLADALECLGDRGRALAMLEELQALDGARDITDRIERLRGVHQGSPRA